MCLCWLRPDAFVDAVDVHDVVAALDEQGVPHPTTPFAPSASESTARRRIDVPIDRLANIRGRLLDAGLLVGFSSDMENGRAWVVVEDGNDTARQIVANLV